MNKTEVEMRDILAALPASGYDLGILGEQGMYRLENTSHARIVHMLPYLKYRNANGAHIYVRPSGESSYTLLDDLTPSMTDALNAEGYDPAAVIETSPGNFQAWLRHLQPLSKELSTLAAKTLAMKFGADGSAADWRRYGRAPGFTNRKVKHRSVSGLFPFARLIRHTGQPFPLAATFYSELRHLHQQVEADFAERRQFHGLRSPHFSSAVTLSRFRESSKYQGRPAAADMAFCIAAISQGQTEIEITAALAHQYLSRDKSQSRRLILAF